MLGGRVSCGGAPGGATGGGTGAGRSGDRYVPVTGKPRIAAAASPSCVAHSSHGRAAASGVPANLLIKIHHPPALVEAQGLGSLLQGHLPEGADIIEVDIARLEDREHRIVGGLGRVGADRGMGQSLFRTIADEWKWTAGKSGCPLGLAPSRPLA